MCCIGAGESGKSTVLKQMRLIHTKGFSKEERKQWKVTIFQNLLHAFQVVFGAMEEQEVDFAEESNIVRYEKQGTLAVIVYTDLLLALCRDRGCRPRDRSRGSNAVGLSQSLHQLMARCRRTDSDQEGQRVCSPRQSIILLCRCGEAIRKRLPTNGPGHPESTSTDDRNQRDYLRNRQLNIPHVRCRWTTIRTKEVDPCLRQRSSGTFLGSHQWLRSRSR